MRRWPLAAVLVLAVLVCAAPAHAVTFPVTQLGDAGDNVCDATCTLRDAIDDANANGNDPVVDNITFSVAGQISIPSVLSALTEPTTIDGTTAPGYVGPDPVVEIDGGGTVTTGLELQGDVTVNGLSVNGFTLYQVRAAIGSSNTITGNYIGIDATGTTAGAGQGSATGIHTDPSVPNNTIGAPGAGRNVIGGNITGIELQGTGNTVRNNFVGTADSGSTAVPNTDGIVIYGSSNTIGGNGAGEGNLISGNVTRGVLVALSPVLNDIRGNVIGLNATQGAAVPNGTGIRIQGNNQTTIGGAAAGAGNVIAGNNGPGIDILNGDLNVIRGNKIGVDATTLLDFPNTGDGVRLFSAADDNVIGGTNPGEGNVIANSGDNGVEITRVGFDAGGNQILGNSIFDNNSLAIDLGDAAADGITANDANDADTPAQLANAGQNFPVLTSVVSAGGSAVATGTLTADTPSAGYRVEIYENSACNPFLPNGEGEIFRVAQTVTTNAAGDASFSIPVPAVTPGDVVTATATRASSGTSEFSACRTATVPAPPAGPPAAGSPPAPDPLPPPEVRKSFNTSVKGGKVTAKCPGEKSFRPLKSDANLPFGCVIDAREGRVEVTSAAGRRKEQRAQFYDGVFKPSQTRGERPITEVRLVGKLENCGKKRSKRASAAARKRKGRRLWGKGKGRFRTRGKGSSALVRGTTWLVEDRCDGSTLTRVTEGSVTVRDFRRRKNVTVKKGKRYVAKARGTGVKR